jgi:hypothetical protein
MVSRCGRITVTGADENTPLAALVALAAWPCAEIGLLYTASPVGRNRYPSRAWLREATTALTGRCALHVCGRGARRALLCGELDDLTRHTPRAQVNGTLTVDETERLATRVTLLITQHTVANAPLLNVRADNHALLVDGSGGRGLLPSEWQRPVTAKQVGFAGGLGQENLRGEMMRIARIALGDYWLDMEGRLRTSDWFDVSKAEAVLRLFHETRASANDPKLSDCGGLA